MLVPRFTARMVTFGMLAPEVSTTVPSSVADVCCALKVLVSPQSKNMKVKLAVWRHSANMERSFTFYSRGSLYVEWNGRSFSDNSDQYIVITRRVSAGFRYIYWCTTAQVVQGVF